MTWEHSAITFCVSLTNEKQTLSQQCDNDQEFKKFYQFSHFNMVVKEIKKSEGVALDGFQYWSPYFVWERGRVW